MANITKGHETVIQLHWHCINVMYIIRLSTHTQSYTHIHIHIQSDTTKKAMSYDDSKHVKIALIGPQRAGKTQFANFISGQHQLVCTDYSVVCHGSHADTDTDTDTDCDCVVTVRMAL
jgi:polynucleotide 5'-kinase involved in rRNA processing